jgi:UDP-N-acetylmuramoyl-tripeptide--D-alanyl-D-alanine ligase
LLSAKASTEFLVVEMGANHPNDIAELCAIAEPNFGIVTNVGKAHLEGFGSLEGVMRAKGKLFEWLFDHDGLAFVNLDNELILSMLMHQKTSGYGVSDSADCSGVLLDSADGYLAAHVIVRAPNAPSAELLDIQTALVGGYNFENLLAACAVGSFFDVPPRAIKEAVEAYRPSNNRSQIEVTAKNRVIKDAYNANPSSMRLAIENFAKSSFANKVLILGEMREVGDFKAREHSEIMDLIASYEWYAVFLVGESYGQGSDRFVCFENTPALVGYLQTKPLEACTVLVKGSRGVKLELCYPEL